MYTFKFADYESASSFQKMVQRRILQNGHITEQEINDIYQMHRIWKDHKDVELDRMYNDYLVRLPEPKWAG